MFEGRALVNDDLERGVFRVHRSAMSSQQVWERERERVFHKCWIYVGHDSEVDKPGDFFRRDVLGHSMFVTRGQDGEVRCFYNTCPHRGATVCREDRGNAKRFTCFYHAWTFDGTGDLVTLPDEDGYGADFDRSERCLTGPPRFEQYRGFWFMSFNPEVVPLDEYLAGAKEYIDLVVDQAEDGMRVVGGSNQYQIGANWKLLCENSVDGYHGQPVHQTYFAYIHGLGGGVQTGDPLLPMGPKQLGNGHVVIEGEAPYARPIARWDPLFGEDAKEDIEAIRARIFGTYDELKAKRMCDTIRLMVVFPNLVINDITAITIRYIDPIAHDRMNVSAWALAPKEEEGDRLARRIDSYLTFIGPAGFATPDDVEALESCQRGFKAVPDAGYSDISRGMKQIPEGQHELQMRAFWRAWAAYMDEVPVPPVMSLPECSGALVGARA
jgi:p-cumate 2,3-dioxygenase alpha subunit